MYQYRPVRWLSIETGVELNSTAYFLHDDYYRYRFYNAMECYSLDCFQPYSGGERVNRIGLPIGIRAHYQVKKLSLNAQIGAVFYSTYSGAYLQQNKNPINYNVEFRSRSFEEGFGLALTTGLGMEYLINNRLIFKVEPRLRVYDIIAPKKHNAEFLKMHPWTVGLNLGLYYQFGQ